MIEIRTSFIFIVTIEHIDLSDFWLCSPCCLHPGHPRWWSWRETAWRTCWQAVMGKYGWCSVLPCLSSAVRWVGIGWWWSADSVITSHWGCSCWWGTSSPWPGWAGTDEDGQRSVKELIQKQIILLISFPLSSRFWLHGLKDISLRHPTAQCTKLLKLYLCAREKKNRVIGFCGLLCGRSHVTMSWVLNVSITGHDKLSWHPRSQLYKPVIDGYTAQLIHFKTLLYGNLWHSFWLPSPWRGTVDSVPRCCGT